MNRSKFSKAQLALIVRQADEGTKIDDACRRTGISEATHSIAQYKATLACNHRNPANPPLTILSNFVEQNW